MAISCRKECQESSLALSPLAFYLKRVGKIPVNIYNNTASTQASLPNTALTVSQKQTFTFPHACF